jgi:hypothetical protein
MAASDVRSWNEKYIYMELLRSMTGKV